MDAIELLRATAEDARARCTRCGACTPRCELLRDRSWTLHDAAMAALSLVEAVSAAGGEGDGREGEAAARVGFAAGSGAAVEADPAPEALAPDPEPAPEGGVATPEALTLAFAADPSLYSFSRTCAACDRCTAICPHGLSMTRLWEALRAALRQAQILDAANTRFVKVDCTWDLFSVYRAVAGVAYPDLPQLAVEPLDAADQGWEPPALQEAAACAPDGSAGERRVVFFAGCTLVSYAPGLVRASMTWLNENVGPALLATECCGSPLVSAGEHERADAWRRRVVRAIAAAGVNEVVTVCPGCGAHLRAAAHAEGLPLEVTSMARLLAESGMLLTGEAFADDELPLARLDSCHDRDRAHGRWVERLVAADIDAGCPSCGADARCCGAGGSVSSFAPQVCEARTASLLGDAAALGARTVLVSCPTCAFTYAQHLRATQGTARPSGVGEPAPLTYLEAAFGERIDWDAVFASLEGMWAGEYADWVAYQLT